MTTEWWEVIAITGYLFGVGVVIGLSSDEVDPMSVLIWPILIPIRLGIALGKWIKKR